MISSVIIVLSLCVVMGIFLGTMAKNKGYNYWKWFFLGCIPVIFPFAFIWIIIRKPATFPEFRDRDKLKDKDKDKDSKFIRKMKEFDRTHKKNNL